MTFLMFFPNRTFFTEQFIEKVRYLLIGLSKFKSECRLEISGLNHTEKSV